MNIGQAKDSAQEIIDLITDKDKTTNNAWVSQLKVCYKQFHDAYHEWAIHDIKKDVGLDTPDEPKMSDKLLTEISEIVLAKQGMDQALTVAVRGIVEHFQKKTNLKPIKITVLISPHVYFYDGFPKDPHDLISGVESKVEL